MRDCFSVTASDVGPARLVQWVAVAMKWRSLRHDGRQRDQRPGLNRFRHDTKRNRHIHAVTGTSFPFAQGGKHCHIVLRQRVMRLRSLPRRAAARAEMG